MNEDAANKRIKRKKKKKQRNEAVIDAREKDIKKKCAYTIDT